MYDQSMIILTSADLVPGAAGFAEGPGCSGQRTTAVRKLGVDCRRGVFPTKPAPYF